MIMVLVEPQVAALVVLLVHTQIYHLVVLVFPTPPYPAPNSSASISTTPTTCALGFSQSTPFSPTQTLTLDLNNLSHSQSSGSVPFTISTTQDLILTNNNFNVSSSSLTIPKIGQPITAQMTQDGLTMTDTTNSWQSWYRKSNAYIANTAGTVYTFIQNGSTQVVNGTNSTSLTPSALTHINSSTGDFNISSNNNLTMSALNCELNSTGRMIFGSSVNPSFTTVDINKVTIQSGTTGGGSNPMLTLNQNDTSAGAGSIRMYKNISTNGSAIGEMSFVAKTAITGNPDREYARIDARIRNNNTSNVDGSIGFFRKSK